MGFTLFTLFFGAFLATFRAGFPAAFFLGTHASTTLMPWGTRELSVVHDAVEEVELCLLNGVKRLFFE
jgi:hypothetical protein